MYLLDKKLVWRVNCFKLLSYLSLTIVEFIVNNVQEWESFVISLSTNGVRTYSFHNFSDYCHHIESVRADWLLKCVSWDSYFTLTTINKQITKWNRNDGFKRCDWWSEWNADLLSTVYDDSSMLSWNLLCNSEWTIVIEGTHEDQPVAVNREHLRLPRTLFNKHGEQPN